MKKNELKKKVCGMVVKTAKESVGRSIPVIFHEAKVPECLKKTK